MLSLHLEPAVGNVRWQATPTGWQAGSCTVAPFRHAALEDFAVLAGDRLLVVVRERCAGQPRPERDISAAGGGLVEVDAPAWGAVAAAMLQWPLQWMMLTVVGTGVGMSAQIQSGDWGVAPVFGVTRGPELFCDWDPARLYPALAGARLDPIRAAHFLAAFDAPYSRETLLPGMLTLTERARMLWNSNERAGRALTVTYPEPVDPPMPRQLKPDADPADAFWRILTSSLQRWLSHDAGVVVEVSGGLDSAVVAAAAATFGASRRSCGLALLGACRDEQRLRRRAVTDLLGLKDHELDICDWLPFTPGTSRVSGGPIVPWEECYYEAVDAMLAVAAADGATLVLTGLGGDELCGRRPGERTAAPSGRQEVALPTFLSPAARDAYKDTRATLGCAPQPLAARSVPECLATGSAMYMRRGLWAVHPLATPQLVRFCAQLPRPWRAGRSVERTLLRRLGYPPELTHPAFQDDFMPALAAGLRHGASPVLRKLFRNSRLADLGLVDRDELLSSYMRWCDTGHDIDGAMPFYAAAILELTLNAIGG